MYNKVKKLTRQQKNQKKFTVREALDKVGSLRESALLVCNYLVALKNGTKNKLPVFPSVDTIAEKTGLSPRSVEYATQKLDELGLVYKQQRWNTSNLYWINNSFFAHRIRKALWKLLPALKFLPLTFMMTTLLKGYTFYDKNYDKRAHALEARQKKLCEDATPWFEAPYKEMDRFFEANCGLTINNSYELYILNKNIDNCDYTEGSQLSRESNERITLNTELIKKAVKELGLSKNGMCKISTLDDRAIENGLFLVTDFKGSGRQRWETFWRIAETDMNSRGIRANWKEMYTWRKYYNLKGTEPELQDHILAQDSAQKNTPTNTPTTGRKQEYRNRDTEQRLKDKECLVKNQEESQKLDSFKDDPEKAEKYQTGKSFMESMGLKFDIFKEKCSFLEKEKTQETPPPTPSAGPLKEGVASILKKIKI